MKTIQEMFNKFLEKKLACINTGNLIGSLDWQKQKECRCINCEKFFEALRKGELD